MAKKCMLERERKRKSLVNKYAKKRELILNELKSADSLDGIFALNEKYKNFHVIVLQRAYVTVVGKLDDREVMLDFLVYVEMLSVN